MSIPVAVAALPEQVSRFGDRAFLITVGADAPPHVASVLVGFDGALLTMRAGKRTHANASERPSVTVLWPAGADGEHCLIVDGVAQPDSPESFRVVPTSAVLHRIAGA